MNPHQRLGSLVTVLLVALGFLLGLLIVYVAGHL